MKRKTPENTMIDILKKRRSVRQFTDQNIEPEKLGMLKEALLLSPTSRNLEPCEFIMVQDKKKLASLSEAKAHGAGFLAGCDTAFVICGDTEKSDVCIEDCSIASIVLQLAAESIGLGSCWAQIRQRKDKAENSAEENVKKLLGLPDRMMVVSIIGIGYPASKPGPKNSSQLKREKIHTESF